MSTTQLLNPKIGPRRLSFPIQRRDSFYYRTVSVMTSNRTLFCPVPLVDPPVKSLDLNSTPPPKSLLFLSPPTHTYDIPFRPTVYSVSVFSFTFTVVRRFGDVVFLFPFATTNSSPNLLVY